MPYIKVIGQQYETHKVRRDPPAHAKRLGQMGTIRSRPHAKGGPAKRYAMLSTNARHRRKAAVIRGSAPIAKRPE